MLSSAFNAILALQSRPMTIERPGKIAAVNIRLAPSNYFRNLSGPEETVVEGREFVVSKQVLDDAGYPAPKRGDRLVDSEIGLNVVSEVREMFSLGAEIIGYRLRTS